MPPDPVKARDRGHRAVARLVKAMKAADLAAARLVRLRIPDPSVAGSDHDLEMELRDLRGLASDAKGMRWAIEMVLSYAEGSLPYGMDNNDNQPPPRGLTPNNHP
jgi:hypothetical protein